VCRRGRAFIDAQRIFGFIGYVCVGVSLHSRYLFASAWICVLVITAAYTSNLTASLTVPKVPWPFKDLLGLAEDDGYEVLVVHGTVQEEVLQVGNIPPTEGQKFRPHPFTYA
jgi:hypothetical protein